MPIAEVVSNGEQIRISYDVYGLDATERDAADGDDAAEEPETNQRSKGVLQSVLGSGIRCNCRPESQSLSSKTRVTSLQA